MITFLVVTGCVVLAMVAHFSTAATIQATICMKDALLKDAIAIAEEMQTTTATTSSELKVSHCALRDYGYVQTWNVGGSGWQ